MQFGSSSTAKNETNAPQLSPSLQIQLRGRFDTHTHTHAQSWWTVTHAGEWRKCERNQSREETFRGRLTLHVPSTLTACSEITGLLVKIVSVCMCVCVRACVVHLKTSNILLLWGKKGGTIKKSSFHA